MMSQQPGPVWAVRYLRVVGGLLLALALLAWSTPVNVLGTNLIPFGCGSPAAPTSGELATFVCTNELNHVKTVALVLLLAGGLVLFLSEVVISRWGGAAWTLGLTVAAPFALPLLGWSVASLFTVLGATAADGTLIRCGTAVAPATDAISTSLCGQLVDRRVSLGVGGALLSVAALAGAAYVGHGTGLHQGRDRGAGDPTATVEPDAGGTA